MKYETCLRWMLLRKVSCRSVVVFVAMITCVAFFASFLEKEEEGWFRRQEIPRMVEVEKEGGGMEGKEDSILTGDERREDEIKIQEHIKEEYENPTTQTHNKIERKEEEKIETKQEPEKSVEKDSKNENPAERENGGKLLNSMVLLQSRSIQNASNNSLSDEVIRKGRSDVERRPKRRTRPIGDRLVFGKRPFGPLSKFGPPPAPNLMWISYFHEESLAVVLKTDQNVMMDCTIIELSGNEEQKVALATFGSMMELVPLALQDMIHLTSLCGELPRNKVKQDESLRFNGRHDINMEDGSQSFSSIVFPGTLWCGMRDRAQRYEHLGDKMELDNCCRAHDHCPLKVLSFKERYGVTNFGFGAKSHCLCEEEFYRCLKKSKDKLSDMIGRFYFDVLKVQCLQGPIYDHDTYRDLHHAGSRDKNLYDCQYMDETRKCLFWIKNDIRHRLKLTQFYLKY